MAGKRRIIIAILDMGLGHATRTLPIIRECRERGYEIALASGGRALHFLRAELPDLRSYELPGYGIRYTVEGWKLPFAMIYQTPHILHAIRTEKRYCDRIVAEFKPDLIVSDHCYGVFSKNCPSYIICHQISPIPPKGMGLIQPALARMHQRLLSRFDLILIPDDDAGNGGVLSGKLSSTAKLRKPYRYIGPLSSLSKTDSPSEIDQVISISGPEPQRTLFENIIMTQVSGLPGRTVVLLGRSEEVTSIHESPELRVYSHASRAQVGHFFDSANLIVSRSGYSTIMEIAALGKKSLLVPTPGQTEQQFLAQHLSNQGIAAYCEQNTLHLERDIIEAAKTKGFPSQNRTDDSIERLFRDLLS